ncbi:MAG: hypothetical protein JNK87_28760 [Bryobacterales bacterium]|nr:hypothetical protein [Bryobacterales bacterium]
MTTRRSWLALPAIFATACSEAPKEVKKKEPEKPPEPVSGRTAFHTMFASARAWAQDAQVLQVQSIRLPEVKAEGGKFPAWQAMLASPSRARLKTYTYSVIEAGGNLHKGIFALQEESFSGSRGQAKPFLVQAIKVDTDAVWETASKKSVEYMKKYPDMPITFLLEQTPRFPNAAWRVIWGESVNTSNYSIFVDASTGEYLATGR